MTTTEYQRERTLDALLGEATYLLIPGGAWRGWVPREDRIASAESVVYAAILVEIIHDPCFPVLNAHHAVHAVAIAWWLSRWTREAAAAAVSEAA